ncbi:MAG: glycosyltransferase [Elusimicrobiota bacterium]
MIYIILPAYNEAAALEKLIPKFSVLLPKTNVKVIVVNDGSTDNTSKVAARMGSTINIVLLEHKVNSGLGTALLTGIKYVVNIGLEDNDVVCTMDADDTHPVDSITGMIEKVKSGYDIIIASRYVPGAKLVGLAFYRRVLSLCAKIILQLRYPYPGLRDYTCGYRVVRGEIIKKAFMKYGDKLVTETNFAATFELLMKLLEFKPKLVEVPLVLRYDLKPGKSKLRLFKTLGGYVKLLFK